MLHIRLNNTNEMNLRRLSQMADVSLNALINYLANKGGLLLEEAIKNMDDEFKNAFKEALKESVKNQNLTTKF